MQLKLKDEQILKHILNYCLEVRLALKEFNYSKEEFASNPVFRNACAMPLMQIGELAKKLSPNLIDNTSLNVPWRAIKGMRDLFAHDYRSMNNNIIWLTATKNIPELEDSINCLLKQTIEQNQKMLHR